MILCMCNRIRLACGILAEASKAVQAMPLITLFPIVPFVMMIVLYAYWCAVGAYLYGVDDSKNQTISFDAYTGVLGNGTVSFDATTSFGSVSEDVSMVNIMWAIHFFGLLWTSQFITAMSMTVVAGAISHWYFTADKSRLGHAPVLGSFYRTFRFHLGSIAFGSLIIAIIQFIRACVKYIEEKCKKGAKNEGAKKIIAVVFCIIQSCLWCIEKCMKFINKNAYILIAMKGCMFCTAAKTAVWLILTNPARIGTVGTVTNFVLTLGKLAVAFGVTFAAIPWIQSIDEVETWWLPCLIIAIMAYSIAYVVFATYDKAVDTILLCVLEDEKLNKDTGKFYAAPSIRKLLDGAGKAGKNAVAPGQSS